MFDVFVSRYKTTTTTTTTTEARDHFRGYGCVRFVQAKAARGSGGEGGGGQRKKTKASLKKKSEKRLKTEFIEREDAKMATFERAEAAARRLSSTTTEAGASSSKSSSSSSSILEEKSFEAKLKRVREEGETRAKMTGGTGGSSTSTSSPAAFGGTPTMTPISPLAPTFGGDESSFGKKMTRKSGVQISARTRRRSVGGDGVGRRVRPDGFDIQRHRVEASAESIGKLWRTSRSKKTN